MPPQKNHISKFRIFSRSSQKYIFFRNKHLILNFILLFHFYNVVKGYCECSFFMTESNKSIAGYAVLNYAPLIDFS